MRSQHSLPTVHIRVKCHSTGESEASASIQGTSATGRDLHTRLGDWVGCIVNSENTNNICSIVYRISQTYLKL